MAEPTAEAKKTKVTQFPAEQASGKQVLSRARGRVARLCVKTDFGLITEAARADALNEALTASRAELAEFNSEARYTELSIHMLVGASARIASRPLRASIAR